MWWIVQKWEFESVSSVSEKQPVWKCLVVIECFSRHFGVDKSGDIFEKRDDKLYSRTYAAEILWAEIVVQSVQIN